MGKSERTKAAMADALEELLRDKPLAKIHVRDITDKAGVDRQTFYYHFDTITDLALYLYRDRTSFLLEDIPRASCVREMFEMVVSVVDTHRDTLKGMLREVGRSAMREILHDDIYAVLESEAARLCAEHEAAVVKGDLDFAVEYCLVASVSLVLDWLDGRIAGTAQDLADRLARAFEQHITGVAAASR